MDVFFLLLLGYLLGSIPSAWLITHKLAGIDIRKAGSGNMGTYNVLRVLGKKPAIFTLIMDAGKGSLAAGLPLLLGHPQYLSLLAALLAVIGHMFPIYLNFKGGKSIAVFSGSLIVIDVWILLLFLACWIILYFISKKITLSSVIAFLITPAAAILLRRSSLEFYIFLLAASLIIIIRHIPDLQEGRG